MNKDYFKSRFTYDKKRDFVWKHLTNYLQRYVQEQSVVLDLGAGYCNFINNIKAKEKYALDLSKDMKKYALSEVRFFSGKCSDMKAFKPNSFDVVFASNLFEHLTKEEFQKTLQEIKRVLKKKGKLIAIQPNYKYCYKNYFDDYTHVTVFTDTGLKDAFEANNLSITRLSPKFIPFSMKSRLSLFHFLIPAYLRSPWKPFAKQMLVVAQKN